MGEGRLNAQGKPQEAARYVKAKAEEALAVCDEALVEAALSAPRARRSAPRTTPQIHFLRAIVLHALNRVGESIAEFRVSLDENGDNADALADLAYVLLQTKQYDEARARCARR